MKNYFIFFLLLTFYSANAQYFSVFDIDDSNYPYLKAKFYAFDSTGKQLTDFSLSDFEILENGELCDLSLISCPNVKPASPISSVLTIDISGSMDGERLGHAKTAAKTWVNAIPLGASECAITSFNIRNYHNQYFTTNKSKLIRAINSLSAKGETDFDAGFINEMSGALLAAENGKHKKIIVFLTDGIAEGNESAIIKKALEIDATVFCITLDMNCPPILKNIASQTGGSFYENISSAKQAQEIYKKILKTVQNATPCEIEWISKINCDVNKIFNITCIPINKTHSLLYSLNPDDKITYEINPSSIKMGKVPLGTSKDTIIRVIATEAEFKCTDIISSNSDFDISPKNFSIPLRDTIELTLTFTPTDSAYSFAHFEFESTACNVEIEVGGGYPNIISEKKTIKLIHPNGGEVFLGGSDTIITWSGIMTDDTVSLEFSINAGKSWENITDSATGLKYHWKNIPKTVSDSCLMKVMKKEIIRKDTVICVAKNDHENSGYFHSVYSIAFSSDGSYIAAGMDKSIYFWDALSGQEIRVLGGHNSVVKSIAFSPDGKLLASGDEDGKIIIWNAFTGDITRTINTGGHSIHSLSWNPESNKIVTGTSIGIINLWNILNGNEISTPLMGHIGGWNCCVSWSPDGTQIVSGGKDNNVKIWKAATGTIVRTLTGHSDVVNSVDWNSSSTQIVSGGKDNSIIIWDASSGAKIRTYTNVAVACVRFSPDDSQIAYCRSNSVVIKDVYSNKVVASMLDEGYGFVISSLAWSPNGKQIATGYTRHSHGPTNLVQLWNMALQSPQSDVSDSLWSIVLPKLVSQDVDMKQVLIGNKKDSLVNDYIRNIGQWQFRVDSIYFRGADVSAFSLASELPPYEIAEGKGHKAEFNFKPTRVGIHQAEVVIITQTDTLIQNIRGEGVEPLLEILTDFIDFGAVLIGKSKDTIQAITIKNIGDLALTIEKTKHNSPNAKDFTTIKNKGTFVLQANDTCNMDLRFTPSDIGRTNGTLEFHYNGIGSPAIVQLFGQGLFTNPQISVSADKFPKLVCGNLLNHNIEISNIGGKPLTIDQLNIIGTNANEFSTIQTTPIVINPDTSKTLIVSFIPNSIGEKTAVLEIISNADPDSIFTFPLIAKKDSVSLVPENFTLNLGVLCPYETKDTVLKIENNGTILSGGYAKFSSKLQSNNSEFILEVNEEYELKFSFTGLSNEGTIDEMIVIYDSTCGNSREVQIIGEVFSPKMEIEDISISVSMGGYKDGIIKVYNNSNRNITIPATPLIDTPFEIMGNSFPLEILANDFSEFIVRYTPDDDIDDTTILLLEGQPCDISQEVTITGIPNLAIIELKKPYFGNTLLCDTQTENLNISNPTEATPITVFLSQSTITGLDANAFSFAINDALIIEPQNNIDIPINFNPTEVRNYEASINLIIDLGLDTTISISGVGVQIVPSTNPKTMTMELNKDYTLPFIVDIPQTQKGYIDKWEFEIIKNNDVVYFKDNSFNPVEKAITWEKPVEDLFGKITVSGTGRIDVSNGYVGELFNLKYSGLMDELTTDNIYFNVIYNCDTIDFNVQTIDIEEICNANLRLIDYSENGNNILSPYPNPITNTFVLNYSVAFDNSAIEIELINSLGQTVKILIKESKNAGKYSETIVLSRITNGMYYLKYTNGKDIKTVKIMINL